MLNRITCLTIINIVSAIFTGLFAQYPSLDNKIKIVEQQKEELINFSEYVFGKDMRLVNGRIYNQPNMKAKGHPFFVDQNWMSGSVTVNGKTFSGLQLNYDIHNDHLIYLDESPDGSKRIILLNKNQVTRFSLPDHNFVKYESSSRNNITESQYFEILHEGEVSLFKKWTKDFESNATQEYPNGKFLDTKTTRYVLKSNTLFKVTSKDGLLEVCEDKKEEMKEYLRKNRIHIRKAPDQELAEFIIYYTRLISE